MSAHDGVGTRLGTGGHERKNHTIVTYLMGPDGEFVDLFTSGVDSKQVIERMTKHVIGWDDSHPMSMVVEEEEEESTK